MEAVVEINKGIFRPQAFAKLFAGNHLAGLFEQDRENLERLLLQPDLPAVLVKLASAQIQGIFVETQRP